MLYRPFATEFDGMIATDGVVPCATVTALRVGAAKEEEVFNGAVPQSHT